MDMLNFHSYSMSGSGPVEKIFLTIYFGVKKTLKTKVYFIILTQNRPIFSLIPKKYFYSDEKEEKYVENQFLPIIAHPVDVVRVRESVLCLGDWEEGGITNAAFFPRP